MRLIIILLLLLTARCSYSKLSGIDFVSDPQSSNAISDSLIKSFQETYDLSMVAGTFYTHTVSEDLLILARKGGKWFKIKYARKNYFRENELPYTLINEKISRHKADSAFSVILADKLWLIRNEDDGCNSKAERLPNGRHCLKTHAETKTVMLLTKTQASIKEYYAPDYFEACCPEDNKDRKLFLRSYNAIMSAI